MRASLRPPLATSSLLAASLFAVTLPCLPLLAQTPAPTPAPASAPSILTIHMLNGKSGKPLGNRFIVVEYQNRRQTSMVYINKHGIGDLEIPPGVAAFSLIAPAKKRGANQAAYIVCGPFGQFLPVSSLLAHGFVPQDACSNNLHLTAHPGEVFYLIEPLPWYTPALE